VDSVQSHGTQVDSSHFDRHQPDAEGEPPQVLPEAPSRAEGPAAQEDARDASSSDQTRAEHSVSETAQERARLPDAQIRR